MNRTYKKEHFFKTLTRGGQLLLHELHMMAQVTIKVFLWLLLLGTIAIVIGFVLTTHSYDRYVGKEWLLAKACLLIDNAHHQQMFVLPDGEKIHVYSLALTHSTFVQHVLIVLWKQLKLSLWAGLYSYITSLLITGIWLYWRGKKQGAHKHIKGDYLATTTKINQLLKQQGKVSLFMIGKEQLILPSFSEMQHFLFHGTTGSGKSTAIKAFLDLIRKRGDRVIIYDKNCNLVEQFYLKEQDQLMNPLDERGVDWSLWLECKNKPDFDNLATALIPMPPTTQDPFWVNAARTIFAAAAHRMQKDNQDKSKSKNSAPKILPLLRYLLTADIGELQSLLKGTEAESLMSEKTEKTAISIKSVLATFLKSLCYIKDGDKPFSIRQWIQDEKAAGWLFISSLGSKHESLKPLITAWLDIAVNSLLSLNPSRDRRIWVVLDELVSLHQVPYLTTALSESRKFGGCFMVGIQSYAQLAKVYSQQGAKEISSLLNTRFIFRVPDPEIAHWSAKNLGEMTIEEAQEGISYGANSIRDGVSLQRIEKQKPLISDSEIIRLNDLTCYVRLPGEYPITKLHFPYVERPSINVPFQERELTKNNLRDEVLQLAEDIEKKVEPKKNKKASPVLEKKKNTPNKDRIKNKDHLFEIK